MMIAPSCNSSLPPYVGFYPRMQISSSLFKASLLTSKHSIHRLGASTLYHGIVAVAMHQGLKTV